MMLNITYNGMSTDHEIDVDPNQLFDVEVRRMAQEIKGLLPGAFDDFVVDRFNTPEGGRRFFLRPKVPFGAIYFDNQNEDDEWEDAPGHLDHLIGGPQMLT